MVGSQFLSNNNSVEGTLKSVVYRVYDIQNGIYNGCTTPNWY